ncbi:hypothetical protein [Zooshikella sp. RANM57]|uniref:hypothetical protein n=1 Tax=Zooshikella sp. RANM57 TaxID=3425863 RepID=UPI003D6F0009
MNKIIVLLLFFMVSGCGVKIQRNYENHVLTSNISPKIDVKIPNDFKLVNSSSGGGFFNRVSGFSGDYGKKEKYAFATYDQKGKKEKLLSFYFYETNLSFSRTLKDEEYFNYGNSVVKGKNYSTHYYVSTFCNEGTKNCFIEKGYIRVMPPNDRRLFSMYYAEVIPCDKIQNGRVSNELIQAFEQRSTAFFEKIIQ